MQVLAEAQQNQIGRTKRERDTISRAKYIQNAQIRYKQAHLLLKEEKARERENAILGETESAKQAEHAKLLDVKEKSSLHRMEQAKVHLRRLLLSRRAGE